MDLMSRVRRRIRRERIAHDFERYRSSRPAGVEVFSDDRSEHAIDLVRQLPPCDVINLHWIASFLDFQTFFRKVPHKTPVVWRLSDMNPFTGGCHCDFACGKFNDGCGQCPQLGSRDSNDLSHQVWNRKQHVLAKVSPEKLHFVAPCDWMARRVGTAGAFARFPLTIIPNSVDIEDFSPQERSLARDACGIPQDANVILFVSQLVEKPYKGLTVLAQALAGLSGIDKLVLVSVGFGSITIRVPIPHLHLGPIHDNGRLAKVYSAADLFVIPSLHDNMPNTVLESMACGTPVVGFKTGGIPDMVRHGITGLLVDTTEIEALRAAIRELLHDPIKRKAMATNCRRIAVDEYSLDLQTRRYTSLYESLCA
jgi:glycosyltransferase involved in cell wall biosynthesis